MNKSKRSIFVFLPLRALLVLKASESSTPNEEAIHVMNTQ